MSFLRAHRLLLLGFLLSPDAAAQSYTGNYTATLREGDTLVLLLKRDSPANASGTLSWGSMRFRLDGKLQPPGLVGSATSDGELYYWEAAEDSAALHLLLADSDPCGHPAYDGAAEFTFARQGTADSTSSESTLGRAGLLRRAHPSSSDRYLGTFVLTDASAGLILCSSDSGYGGLFLLGFYGLPVTARKVEDHIAGTFQRPPAPPSQPTGEIIPFEAHFAGDTLVLTIQNDPPRFFTRWRRPPSVASLDSLGIPYGALPPFDGPSGALFQLLGEPTDRQPTGSGWIWVYPIRTDFGGLVPGLVPATVLRLVFDGSDVLADWYFLNPRTGDTLPVHESLLEARAQLAQECGQNQWLVVSDLLQRGQTTAQEVDRLLRPQVSLDSVVFGGHLDLVRKTTGAGGQVWNFFVDRPSPIFIPAFYLVRGGRTN